jgi:hypothetical protein
MHLNDWFDLIFGCYQRSLERNNLYHCYSYPDCVDHLSEEDFILAQRFCANFGTCPLKLPSKPHMKSGLLVPPVEHFELVFDKSPSSVLLFEKLVVVDRKGELMRISGGSRSSFNLIDGAYLQVLWLEKSQHLIILHKYGGFVIVLPQEQNRIGHTGSPIGCIAEIDARRLVTAGSDYLICVWSTTTFGLVGTIPVHLSDIVAIAADKDLNVVACINKAKMVSVCWLSEMKEGWNFDSGIASEFASRILVLQNGLLAITSELAVPLKAPDETCKIVFFSLQGRRMGEVVLEGQLIKLFPIATKGAENFLVATTTLRKVIIVNCSSCRLEKVLEVKAFPELVMAIDDTKRLMLVSPSSPRTLTVVKF